MPDKLKVVLCWHMHQPVYHDLQTGQYQLPWTYLHGIKDYVDMAAHLEATPQARAVVNFVPTLLEQLDDYSQQIQAFLRDGSPISDPLLAALVAHPPYAPFLKLQATEDKIAARLELVNQCLRANKERFIQRFLPYHKLAEFAEWFRQKSDVIRYLDDQYLKDIIVWYHLVWLGETVRRQDVNVQALIKKGQDFSDEERRQLLEIIGELLGNIIHRYKALAARGQVELSFTPYAHPIMPLLLEVKSAREALPHINLPHLSHYTDGEMRVRWHIREGLDIFKKYFGSLPKGCWPSEGSISDTTVRLLGELGIRWVASGEGVLRNSLNKAGRSHETTHRPYRLSRTSVCCFFRDDRLSDLLGFEYAKWHADHAVANLIHHLENIANSVPQTGSKVTSIIMDGENAWEHYPENAYYFLSALYKRLSDHPKLEMSTFSQCLDLETTELPTLVAGSWVYGTFSTWIGDKDKNRAWEMLNEAKGVFDRVIHRLKSKQRIAAERQLAICEGSDWCWWFGDLNPAESVRDFDKLYRSHLVNLYHLLGEPPPHYLSHAFSHGGSTPQAVGGVMRKSHE